MNEAHSTGRDLQSLSRAELEAEILQLRTEALGNTVSAARQKAVFDSALDFAIVVTDRDGVITEWNSGAENVMGWTADEMRGQDAARFFTPEDRAAGRVAFEMETSFKKGRASDERWHLRKGERRFWASGEMMPLRDDAGAHIGFVKILRDRTAEHLAGVALREGQQRREALLELGDQLAVHDETNASLTDAACSMLGRVLNVDLVGYGQVDPGAETITVERDWTANGAASLAGTLQFRDFGSYIDDLKRDETVIVRDARTDPRTRDHAAALEARSARAFVNAPVLEHGHFVGLLYVSTAQPRDWTEDELLFVREVASRTRVATARWQAESELRKAATLLSGRADQLSQEVAERASELRLYRNIVESDQSPILAFDRDYRLIGFNQAHREDFLRVMGHEQHIGDVLPDLFPPDQAAQLRGMMDKALAGERFVVVEEFGDPDGEKPTWEITYSPLIDEHSRVLGGFHHARDISERVRADAELRQVQEQLRQSQKMEAVGQLTGGLAHDFNNLLAVIIGSLELLTRRIAAGRLNDIDRFLTASQTAAKRASSLTHRLLAFSRRQTLDPQQTDVNALIAGMAEMVRRTVGPEIAVEIIGAPDLWTTLVDPGQLENALLNLCINARDAMPEGGRIMIETANKVLDKRAAQFRDMEPGEFLVLSVTDTGTGMPPEVVARVFEPFFTTKPIGQGTGLGLSMVYGFARQSEGQVRIHSEVGKGTTINIYLPRSEGVVPAIAAEQGTAPEKAQAGQTVLVVDDEQNVRMLVVDVLEELGYTAIEANDGLAGLKVLQSDLRVDLLVTDVGMPGMNGRQLADAARVARPDLKVLFITGYAETAVVSHGHLEQGMAIVTKPFAIDDLAARIKSMIDGNSGRPQSKARIPASS